MARRSIACALLNESSTRASSAADAVSREFEVRRGARSRFPEEKHGPDKPGRLLGDVAGAAAAAPPGRAGILVWRERDHAHRHARPEHPLVEHARAARMRPARKDI